MLSLRATSVALTSLAFVLVVACGGAPDPIGLDPSGSTSSGDASSGPTSGSAQTSGTTNASTGATSGTAGGGGEGMGGGGAGGEASTGAGGGEPQPEGLGDVGSLVVLGDSIGDGGGQGPYYYALLRDSLELHYGKQISYQRKAQSGSKTGALVGQINSLPNSLPGPVVVTITSGGNDMKDQLFAILTGTDGPAREQMGANIDAALQALSEPDRFGAGVEVFVFYANIYDASDGEGNFASGGCTINMDAPGSTDPYFDSWNGEIADQVAANAQVLADMHGHFYGHGFNNPPTWYANDCTHPNQTGHGELEDLFFGLITGEP